MIDEHLHSIGIRSVVPRRGFTLLESLMAAGILLGIVVAVAGAVTAGQHHAYAAHQRIAGTIAAEELLGRIIADDYDDIDDWDGYAEAPGSMKCFSGADLPDSFAGVGRLVEVTGALKQVTGTTVNVQGLTVRVAAVDTAGNILAELEHYIAEPAGNPAEIEEHKEAT